MRIRKYGGVSLTELNNNEIKDSESSSVDTSKSRSDAKKKKKKSKLIPTIATIILVIILLFSIWQIMVYMKESNTNKEVTSNIEEIATDETGEEINFEFLLEENPDTKAWLKIPGTDVNNVVVQHEEEPTSSTDFYYLNRDFYGDYSQYGTLFFEPSCTVEPGNYSQNLIIFGHNMRNGQMFGTLTDYKDEAYYQEHPTITLETPEGVSTYNIFAVMEASVIPTEEDPEPFYYIQPDFSSQEEFMAYVDEAKSRSLYDIPVEVNEGDEILTLSTCHDFNDDKRFVIFAVKDESSSEQ